MSAGTNLVVPVVLWGKSAPTHCISCIFLSRDQRTLVTGCHDGQICLWQVDPDTLQMIPRCLLVGHTAPILCLARVSVVSDNNYIVSSSESGEMCTWDLVDGKCREVVKLPYVHTNMQAYHMCGSDDIRLFCNGYYAEVLIMDPFSLEVLFTLSSRMSPDWICALHVLRPAKRKDDVILGLTTTGMVKVWTLQGNESKATEPHYEHESKQIRCLNALSMSCCGGNQRTVVIVCAKYWQIYDAGDFSILCSVQAPRSERWISADFLSTDRVIAWSDEGKGYMYKLPANSVADNKEFHSAATESDTPFLYCVLAVPNDRPMSCPPAMRYHEVSRSGKVQKYLLRGDSDGAVVVWNIPEVTNSQLAQIKQEEFDKPPGMPPTMSTSLTKAWAAMQPSPVGILDQLERGGTPRVPLTASMYLPQQSRLVVGREDGSIIIVPATQTVMLHLLHGNHQQYDDWPPHQRLIGHVGRVNCLLYPHLVHPRYERAHLVSGGVDFAVCLWDLYSGTLLHRFCVHAGEITQLLVPPNNCSTRVQKCICSVASDHSVTLLGLTERKCVVLASRHLFPVVTIKWRPLDDFMIVGCSDGSVYVWQMETGHLDRVLHGISAEEVLYACDENTSTATAGDSGLANPAVHFFRGLRHRNLSAIRHATQRGIHQLQQLSHHNQQDGSLQQKGRAMPLMIQGLRTNPKDPESHILCFDIEALIGILAKMKEGAETMQTKIQAKAESVGLRASDKSNASEEAINKPRNVAFLETNITMEIAQLLLSLLHAWGMEPELDRVCETKLGLLRPMVPVSFGVISKGGYMSLLLPTWKPKIPDGTADPVAAVVSASPTPPPRPPPPSQASLSGHQHQPPPGPAPSQAQMVAPPPGPARKSIESELPREMVQLERLTRLFTARTHWELSTTLTTNHLLATISLAYTLMSMNNATFVTEQERSRILHRQSTRTAMTTWSRAEEETEEQFTAQQAHIKQGWSRLATLHCVQLPDKVTTAGSRAFKRPQVEMMARRWQHHCLEVRQAAQALLLAELERLGPKGRKALVDSWAPFLPMYAAAEQQAGGAHQGGPGAGGADSPGSQGHSSPPQHPDTPDYAEEEEEGAEELCVRKPSSAAELKRKQTTAVVLLGVIGAEFGQDMGQEPVSAAPTPTASSGPTLTAAPPAPANNKRRSSTDVRRKSSVVEGFGLGNNNLARLTSLALTHLLLAPPSPRLPAHTALRRAAVDLIGRGFTVWEPYLDVSKVLIGLLELCCDSDRLVPSMTYGLPLTPAADSSRTARHALTLIATARPAAFITTMAKEVARYNTLQQNAQTLNVNLSNSVLHRAKPEILHAVEHLIDKMPYEMSDFLVEVMDIVLHCLDPGHLKTRSLQDVFPAIRRFNQVSHCSHTRRIAVGAKSGQIALYELRSSKCPMISGHSAPITACAFSPDGKYLASYSCGENRLCFWQQTSTGMFGLGNSQTRCIKSYSTSPLADITRLNPMRLAKLSWTNNRTVSLKLADNSETPFNV